MRLQCQVQIQMDIGIVHVQLGNFGNPIQAVDERVAVNVQFFSRQPHIAIAAEKRIQRNQQIALMLLIIFDDVRQPAIAERTQLIWIHSEQQFIQTQVAKERHAGFRPQLVA